MKNNRKNNLLIILVFITIACNTLENGKMEKQQPISLNNDTSKAVNNVNNEFIQDSNIDAKRSIAVYKDLIDKYKNDPGPDGKGSKSLILKCFPRTEDEYLYFYSLSTKDNKTFEEIGNDLYLLADLDYANAFILYLSMIDFVDGEYAEFFLQNIDILISKKAKRICLIYNKLSEHTKEVIDSYYIKYCK